MDQRHNDGDWVLYYSEEGYPYYYNTVTGQSEWADYNHSHNNDQNLHPYDEYANYSIDQNENENEYNPTNISSEKSDDEDDNSSNSESDISDSETTESYDEEFNRKFEKFIKTPQGMAAILAERQRIESYYDKKLKEEEKKAEHTYVRSLLNKKKMDDDAEEGQSISYFANRLLGILGIEPVQATNKENASTTVVKSGKLKQQSIADKFDDYGREATQRRSQATKSAVDEENPSRENLSSPSRISTSSSDNDSISSDDSDVAVINAPMFSEFETIKNNFNSLTTNILTSLRTFFQESSLLQTGRAFTESAMTHLMTTMAASTSSIGEYLTPIMNSFVREVLDTRSPNQLRINPINSNTTEESTQSQHDNESDSTAQGGQKDWITYEDGDKTSSKLLKNGENDGEKVDNTIPTDLANIQIELDQI